MASEARLAELCDVHRGDCPQIELGYADRVLASRASMAIGLSPSTADQLHHEAHSESDRARTGGDLVSSRDVDRRRVA